MGRPPISKESWGKIQVKRLDDGRVRVRTRVRDADGWTREVTRIRGSETAAVRALKKELRDRTAPPRGAIRPTTRLGDVAREFFRLLEQDVDAGVKGPQTLRRYKESWAKQLEPRVSGWQVREVDAELCVRVLEEVRQNYSASSTSLTRAVFSGILQIAHDRGVMARNPLVGSGIRIKGDPKKPIETLEPRQVQKLIVGLAGDEVGVRQDLPDIMFWMLCMGERIAGALALHWPYIDFDNRTAEIGRNVIIDKNGNVVLNERDRGKVNIRTVSVPEPALAMLANRWGKRSPMGGPWNSLGPVWPNRFGNLRRPNGVGQQLRPVLNRIGFTELKPHTMRKTHATTLARAGLSLDAVAGILGHRSVDTTRGYYAKPELINPTAVAAVAALLDVAPTEETVVHGKFG